MQEVDSATLSSHANCDPVPTRRRMGRYRIPQRGEVVVRDDLRSEATPLTFRLGLSGTEKAFSAC